MTKSAPRLHTHTATVRLKFGFSLFFSHGWWVQLSGGKGGLSHLELVGFSSNSAGLNHGDEDGDVTQRTALPSCYTHPKGVAETLRYTGGRIKGEQNDI